MTINDKVRHETKELFTPITKICSCGAELDKDRNCPVCDPWEEDQWDDDFLGIV